MNGIKKVTRRDFLVQAGLGAGALVLGTHVSGKWTGGSIFAQEAAGARELNTFVAIKADGTIVIMSHRSEMGQGIRATLPAVVADELEADWSRVEVRQAIGDEKYGNQWTDGSRSVTLFLQKMHEFGATARHMLLEAAADKLQVDVAECVARNHQVVHEASGRSFDYGELAQKAARLRPPDPADVKLKSAADYRYIGKEGIPFNDLDDIVTGKAVYGADVDLPGMLTAMIVRCPVVGGKAKSFDDTDALKVPGVKKVSLIPGWGRGGLGAFHKPLGGVAVLAENTWAAFKGRAALENDIVWDLGPHAGYESKAYRHELEASTAKPGKVVRNKGNVDAALEEADKVVEASYYIPHLVQAPMEPPVATALLADGKLEIWAATQSAQAAQEVAEDVLGIEHTSGHGSAYQPASPDSIEVTVHVTLLGGGFGRKSINDFVGEAALLAKQNPGVPVRLQWSREDDIQHSYYHAVSHQTLKAALDAEGRPTAWLQRSAFPSLESTIGDGDETLAGPIELAQGLVGMPFDLPNIRLENCEAEPHTRIGWMRSVANIYHAFAINSFAGELAAAAGRDPKDYLLELIGEGRQIDLDAEGVEDFHNNTLSVEDYPVDTARLRGVIERVAQEAGWGKQMPAGRGLGIAAHRSFASYVAMVVDAEVTESNELVVHEVYGAIDCGLAVNPERVRAQMEGGIIYGLSFAIHDEISHRDGAVVESNFFDYPTLRLNQAPKKISVHIVDSGKEPGGVGEPPTPPVAPALTNAIVAAGGPRVRDLPLWKVFDFG